MLRKKSPHGGWVDTAYCWLVAIGFVPALLLLLAFAAIFYGTVVIFLWLPFMVLFEKYPFSRDLVPAAGALVLTGMYLAVVFRRRKRARDSG